TIEGRPGQQAEPDGQHRPQPIAQPARLAAPLHYEDDAEHHGEHEQHGPSLPHPRSRAEDGSPGRIVGPGRRDRPPPSDPVRQDGPRPTERGGSVSEATTPTTDGTEAAEFAELVAIVTGGASGLGLAIADELADRGAQVAVLDIAEPTGGRHTAVRCDVTDSASTDAAVAEVADRFGRIDVVVNNAGIGAAGTVA